MKRPWNSRLIYKFFLSHLAIVIPLAVGFYFYTGNLLKDFHVASLDRVMDQKSRVLARVLPWSDEPGSLDALCKTLSQELGVRITVIARDGRVIGDSDEPAVQLENHGTRPEVAAALSHGTGSAVRYSTTVKHDLLYRAYRQTQGDAQRVVRVAVSLSEIQNVTRSFGRALLAGLLLALVLGSGVAYYFSRRLSARVNRLVEFSRAVAQGDFSRRSFVPRGGDELDLLEQHLQEMSAKIKDNIQELVSEKEKVDSILRCMIEGLVVIDARGRLLLMNDQARKMFQVAADRDVTNATLAEISRHPELHRVVSELARADLSAAHYSEEIALSEGRWFRVNGAPLQDGRGHLLGFLLVFNDITELKRLETVRSDFVANVSHELRTPLTAIQGYVETLLRTPPADPKEAASFLEIIERHAERLGRLTGDLLTLSDLESGRSAIVHQPVEVKNLIQRVLEVFMDGAAKKQVALTDFVEPDLPPLSGAPDRLQQLLINLVDNAIKYTPPGGEVQVSGRLLKDDGEPRIELAVSDTGLGIPEKDIPRLTERFYRVDKTRSRDLGGTGLGLAIVKHIVQAHGGELKIESVVQKGTTVRITLPAAAPQEKRKTILFLCTGNSCRSQMAEGFARHLAPAGTEIFSAGTEPKGLHPLAVQVMNEVGIDISGQRSKGIEAVPIEKIDLLVTLCGEAEETCPALAAQVERQHWPLRDPAVAQGSEDEVLKIFREVRDEIQSRVEYLLASDRALPRPTGNDGEP
ncbi:MAG: PAS-domain containing protein [Deltaproteobacteria bacterium]|nr:PAS-domain containing protein [Deltaproteobacteria bacterium]